MKLYDIREFAKQWDFPLVRCCRDNYRVEEEALKAWIQRVKDGEVPVDTPTE